MYRLISKLVIYREFEKDSILARLSDICETFYSGEYDRDALITQIYTQINALLKISTRYGFDTNLWHNYLAFILAMSENPFTMVCEKVGANEGSVNAFARSDFRIFKELFDYDFSEIEQALGIDCFTVVRNYQAVVKSEQIYNKSVSEKVQSLSRAIERAADDEELYRVITQFYQTYGVGKIGLNKAFRVRSGARGADILEEITSVGDMKLDDLVGYEEQKEKLIANTEAFVSGRKANNVLLFGDAGTGKSTSVKAILNQYYSRGLRMIEVYKHQFQDLNQVIAQIKDRNYRFIIYMDDLSFEEFEIEYKYLKAVIEGGLERKPDNILIYATSNRRHLVRERAGDKLEVGADDDIHSSDTVQEKLSLVYRFGVRIYFGAPDRKEFHTIVKTLAARHGIQMPEDQLLLEAGKWEISHGGLTGRTAQQFIDHLLGKEEN